MDAATAAGAAADSFAAALEKAGKERALRRRALKVADGRQGLLPPRRRRTPTKFGSDMSAAVDAARAELEGGVAKLLKAGDKKPLRRRPRPARRRWPTARTSRR